MGGAVGGWASLPSTCLSGLRLALTATRDTFADRSLRRLQLGWAAEER
jgi:hypothetical protein